MGREVAEHERGSGTEEGGATRRSSNTNQNLRSEGKGVGAAEGVIVWKAKGVEWARPAGTSKPAG